MSEPDPASRLEVVHIIVGLDVGGAELMLKRLIASFDASGRHHHRVISLTSVGPVGLELQRSGIEVLALGMRSALSFPLVLMRIRRLLKDWQPDVVQTWMYHADLLGGLAARLAGIDRVIWGVRTTEVNAGGSSMTNLVRRLCALCSARVPRFIVCAAEASRRAHVAVGYDERRMQVVPNGFDMQRLVPSADARAALRAELGIGAATAVVGYLGRFHPAKDQRNFVRAAALVAASRSDVRFLLVGRGLDAGNRELMAWITATGCAERFILLGERHDVAACLSAIDVFGLSSLTEGFPNVVGEAMAMGKPCVVTDVGDAAMLVAETGVVVPRADPAALAAGLMQLLELPEEARLARGHRARMRITSSFSMESARERFDAIYRTVANEERT